MVASGACFALLALSGIKLTSERDGRGSGLSEERERMPGQTLIFLFQRSKRMIFLLSLLFLILFCQRERRDKEISKGKSAVRHSVNALSWAPCFHKNLVLSIYLSCRIEGNINSGLFMMDSLCLLITSHNYGTHFSFNFLN